MITKKPATKGKPKHELATSEELANAVLETLKEAGQGGILSPDLEAEVTDRVTAKSLQVLPFDAQKAMWNLFYAGRVRQHRLDNDDLLWFHPEAPRVGER